MNGTGTTSMALRAVLILAVCQISAAANGEALQPPADALDRPAPSRLSPGLEDRVRNLAQALDLDATQQSELRKLLASQREQVRKIWNDSSVPPAYRVSATRAISDQTADRIRAMLNEEQSKKYILPKPPQEALAGSPRPSVEDWMNAAKAK
jgi:hypothetical protein